MINWIYVNKFNKFSYAKDFFFNKKFRIFFKVDLRVRDEIEKAIKS